MKRRGVLFVSKVQSRFQVDLFNALGELSQSPPTLIFTDASLEDRAPHWRLSDGISNVLVAPMPEGAKGWREWMQRQLSEVNPTAIICGGYRGPRFDLVCSQLKQTQILGLFCEQIAPRPSLVEWAIRSAYGKAVRRHASFILAVGSRAVAQYERLLGRSHDVYWFPYYQTLPKVAPSDATRNPECVTFLFSGRLVQRNRPLLLLQAFARLRTESVAPVRLCFAARGPEERRLRRAIERDSWLKERVAFDTEYVSWNDRLRPFLYSDVLVMPSQHSGWGLVIQEAMHLGTVVLASRGIEAARDMIRHGENGLFTPESAEGLGTTMAFLANNAPMRSRLASRARDTVRTLDAKEGARRLWEILEGYTPSAKSGAS